MKSSPIRSLPLRNTSMIVRGLVKIVVGNGQITDKGRLLLKELGVKQQDFEEK